MNIRIKPFHLFVHIISKQFYEFSSNSNMIFLFLFFKLLLFSRALYYTLSSVSVRNNRRRTRIFKLLERVGCNFKTPKDYYTRIIGSRPNRRRICLYERETYGGRGIKLERRSGPVCKLKIGSHC